MNDELPLVSVLIPVHPHVTEVKSAEAARRFDYPRDKLEIVIVRTTDLSIGPGVKRNAGLKAIRGELVYFLDDDSVADPGNVKRAVRHFSDPQVKVVGGPNVCPPDAPLFERVLGLVMGSWLAFGPSRTRYHPVGKLRECGEKELISSHLIARRDAVLEVGFDPKLWPNEENAMMNGIKQRGGKLLYDPEFLSRRRPRRTLYAYAKMLLFYGGGRSTISSVPERRCCYQFYSAVVLSLLAGVAVFDRRLLFHENRARPVAVAADALSAGTARPGDQRGGSGQYRTGGAGYAFNCVDQPALRLGFLAWFVYKNQTATAGGGKRYSIRNRAGVSVKCQNWKAAF